MNSPTGRQTLLGAAGGTARLMAYSLLAISLMALDHRGRYVDQFRAVAGQLVEPLVLLIDLPFHGAERFGAFWTQRSELVERVRQLEREAVEREASLGELADLAIENDQLRALLEAAPRPGRRYLAAELASIDLDPFAHRIIVKRGRDDGLDLGMPVIDERGVLGQIESVFRNTAGVILLTDPDHALPVQVLPSGERTIAYGTGVVDRLRLDDLPMNTELQPGDLAVTSGLGGQFPPGLPVGRVLSVERPRGEPFARAEIEPLSAMDRNRLVLILAPEASIDAAADAEDSQFQDNEPQDNELQESASEDADPPGLIDDESVDPPPADDAPPPADDEGGAP